MRMNRPLMAAVAVGTAVLAGLLLGPSPAVAHDGGAKTAAAACAAALPLTTPCEASVSSSGSTYTITVPGVGTLTFSLDANGVVTDPTATGTNDFIAGDLKVDGDGAVATFTNPTTGQIYKVDADVKNAAGAAPTVRATVRAPGDHHCGGSDPSGTDASRTGFWSDGARHTRHR